MFCPKCGTENPEQGKFCRKCGTDISGVARAIGEGTHTGMDLVGSDFDDLIELTGGDPADYSVGGRRGRRRSENPDDLVAAGIKSAVMGFGFLIVSALLFFTGVAGGHSWWWAMLIPAFTMLVSGLGNVAKSKRLERRLGGAMSMETKRQISEPNRRSLDQAPADFSAPAGSARYETGEIVPPSVVEGTTRHLEMDSEGETMTLPEINKE